MSPLKPVRPTMAPDVTVDAVSAKANWNNQNARNATLGRAVRRRHAVQEEVLVADEAVAVPELEGEADRPVEESAQARVEHALEEHVDRFPGPGETGLEAHEPGLHEEDQERGNQHPDRVDRTDEVVGVMLHDRELPHLPAELKYQFTPASAPRSRTTRRHLAGEDHPDEIARVLIFESLESSKHVCNIETHQFPVCMRVVNPEDTRLT